MYKRYPRSLGLSFSTDPHNVLKFLKRSSKHSKSSEVHKRYSSDLNSSKIYQRPQNPVVVKGSSNVHQMVLTKSSKFPKNSPQKVHKKSSKGPENSSMLWDPQVRRSSKSPQKVHKVHKRSRKCTKGPQRPQPSGPLMFLKLLKRSSKSSKSSKVLKR